MPLFDDIAATIGASLMGNFFYSPLIMVAFIYLIAVGIALFSKSGLEGMLVTVTLATIINANWFLGPYIGRDALLGLVAIFIGIITSLALMKWLRK